MGILVAAAATISVEAFGSEAGTVVYTLPSPKTLDSLSWAIVDH
jgi:hypothetical protein